MKRRNFLRCLGGGLAAGWAGLKLFAPGPAQAAPLHPRLALLADAHLQDGAARRPEARALARAVAEIRGLNPPPHLVLFAGDLAHQGNPKALALGREILADLPGPRLLVRGEGDGVGPGAAAWPRLFGEPRFSLRSAGFHLLGIDTYLSPSPQGPVFEVGREQRLWLARELTRLDPDTPLIILSHAPLVEIFRPWRQWTKDGAEVMHLLSRFSQVYCFHGHVHHGAVSFQPAAFSYNSRGPDKFFLTENRKLKTENHSLPATAWPLPSPLQGTLAVPRPGLGPQGCGWGLLSAAGESFKFQPQVWPA